MISQADVKAVLEKYAPSTSLTSREEAVSYLANIVQENPDILLYFLSTSIQSIRSNCQSILASLDIIDSCLDDALRETTPPTAPLTRALYAAGQMKDSLTDYGRFAGSAKTALSSSLGAYSEALRSHAVVGAALHRSAQEASETAAVQAREIFVLWNNLLPLIPYLQGVVAAVQQSPIYQINTKRIVTVVEEELSIAEQSPERVIDNLLSAQVAQYLVDRSASTIDLSLPKYTGDLYPAAPCTPATMLASRSAPYRITSSNNTVALLAQAASQVFSLPESLPGRIEIGDGPFTLTANSKASVAATNTGPYTTPVRSTAADGAFAGTTRLFTSASATFTSTNQVGDLIVLSGTYSGQFYIEAILDDNSLVLSGTGTVAAGINYSTYRSNKFVINVRGTLYRVALSVGASIAYTTWESELSSALSGIATVSSSGGLITIEDAGAAGEDSQIQVISGEAQALLGVPTTLSSGTIANNEISIETETATDSFSLSAGAYTASSLAAAINGAASAAWEAQVYGTTLYIQSAVRGVVSSIQLLKSLLGVPAGTYGTGKDVSLGEVVDRINSTRSIGLIASENTQTLQTGVCVQTAASLVITDSTKDFSALGVIAGDIVVLGSGPNTGTYHVQVVGVTTLTLSTADAKVSGWKAHTGGYTVQRRVLSLTSTSTGVDTKIGVPTHTELGLGNTNYFGQTVFVEIGSPAENPLDYGITVRDYIEPSTDIAEVSATALRLLSPIASNTSLLGSTIHTKAYKKYAQVKSLLDTWVSTEFPRLPVQGISYVLDLLERAFRSKSPIYVGDARQWVTVLTEVVDALYDALSGYALPDYPGLSQLKQQLTTSGYPAMVEYLEKGDYRKVFSPSSAFSSSANRIRSLLEHVQAFLPTHNTLEVSLEEEDYYG